MAGFRVARFRVGFLVAFLMAFLMAFLVAFLVAGFLVAFRVAGFLVAGFLVTRSTVTIRFVRHFAEKRKRKVFCFKV